MFKEEIAVLNEEGYEYYKNNEYERAFLVWSEASNIGSGYAKCSLAYLYETGLGVERDFIEALKLYEQAERLNYENAKTGFDNCKKLALNYYMDLIMRDKEEGSYGVGLMHYHGWYFPKNYEKATVWLQKAAEKGYANAQDWLGLCYYLGQGVEQNYEKAVEWYQKAADQGHAGAQCNLGICYDMGHGVEQSDEIAAECFQKSANQGNAEAQYNLGLYYENGQGVKQSHKTAARWYQKAANQGHANAQYAIGYCYYIGQGVENDLEMAVEWLSKAAMQGHENANKLLKRIGIIRL